MDKGVGILIVEDNFLTAEDYRASLEHAGFSDVRLAAGADVALREARLARPVLAIVDLQLEGRGADDGLAVADALLRAGVEHVIIATGYHPKQVEARRLVRPPAAILQKPVLAAVLVAAVRRCLPQPD